MKAKMAMKQQDGRKTTILDPRCAASHGVGPRSLLCARALNRCKSADYNHACKQSCRIPPHSCKTSWPKSLPEKQRPARMDGDQECQHHALMRASACTSQTIEFAALAIRGQRSAHSLATGPVMADPGGEAKSAWRPTRGLRIEHRVRSPFISPFGLTMTPALSSK